MGDQRSPGRRSLCDVFMAHLPEPLRQKASAVRLEPLLSELLLRGREAWPEVSVNAEAYMIHLAERLPPDAEPEEGLDVLQAADLYLACGCLHGDGHAFKAFASQCLSDVSEALRWMDPSGSLADEIHNVLAHRLLVGDGERMPKLAQYRGKGTLRKWLQVAAVRHARNLRNKQQRERPLDDRTLEALVSPDDQELSYLKALYRDEFRSAFHEALATLSSKERNVLRNKLLDGLSIDDLGALYRVHRSTAARWLKHIHAKLHSETRRVLSERLALAPDEFDSIVRLVMSQLDASLRRFLTDDER